MSDQESAVKNLVDMLRDSRTHGTAVINTPNGSSASADGIERANYEVEKQIRTLRSRFEENFGESVGLDHKMLPFLVRHCAWQITHYQVKSDGRTLKERLRGRPYQGQVAEFAEVVHFRDPGKTLDMPKLDDRWNQGLWQGKSLASDEHYVGTSAGVRKCPSIWERPENQRWNRKVLNEMSGDPWNPAPQPKETPQTPREVYITVDRQIKCGGTKVCPACFGHAKVHSPQCRARFQEIVDNEAAQTETAGPSDANAETSGQAAGGSAPSSSSAQIRPRVVPRGRTPTWKWLRKARQHSLRSQVPSVRGCWQVCQHCTNLTRGQCGCVQEHCLGGNAPRSSRLSRSQTRERNIMESRLESCLKSRRYMRDDSESLRTLKSWRWPNPFRCRKPELRTRKSSAGSCWTMRKGRPKTQMWSGADWLRHRLTRTPART